MDFVTLDEILAGRYCLPNAFPGSYFSGPDDRLKKHYSLTKIVYYAYILHISLN